MYLRSLESEDAAVASCPLQAEYAKAWRTTVHRIAAVRFAAEGTTFCAASLHVSKSEGTADFIESLKAVLEDVTQRAARTSC